MTREYMHHPPTNPSEEFGGVDYHSYFNPDRKLSVETAGVSVEAAKPYMDAATDLHRALVKAQAAGLGMDEFSATREYGADVLEEHAELGCLIDYARRKSEQAVANGVAGELTRNEKIILDAYSADADLALALADLEDIDSTGKYSCDTDTLERMSDEAYKRSCDATDTKERHRWRKMAEKIDGWEWFLHRDPSTYYSEKEFNLSAKNAGYLLSTAMLRNAPDVVSVVNVVTIEDVVRDTRMMREQAEMFRFFAEICSADSSRRESSSSDKTLRREPLSPEEVERMKEQIANIPTQSSRPKS